MLIRGFNDVVEYNRDDQTFYKGIVIKNNDPHNLFRVKVFIPELSNQPDAAWLDDIIKIYNKFPGSDPLERDSWSDKFYQFEQIARSVPWAEPCFPIMGESGPGRYCNYEDVSTISETNDFEEFQTNYEEDKPPTLKEGVYSPAWVYEHKDAVLHDIFKDPVKDSDETGKGVNGMAHLTGNSNPYSYITRPSALVNKSKGVFGVPEIGSKVWVFHYNGDINLPVYFGVYHDYREYGLVANHDQPNSKKQSLNMPDIFENWNKGML